MRRGLRDLGELLARLGADADSGLATGGDEALQALVVAFASYQNLVESALPCPECFFDRVQPVEDVQGDSLVGRRLRRQLGAGQTIQAYTLFGSLKREGAMNLGRNSDAELSTESLDGQWRGDGLTGGFHVSDRGADGLADAGKRCLRRGREPGK